ncbi:GNAT family N-acetyltransferase [Spongiactinospora rosea]|uniref:GNAT family N-acetyltransferase n=1 Tax=Spongiactinospora rosea TaxID=2248750 RepID=UPI001CEC8FBA|nr:GNAT family N-acetyltransferase [Spongiactinospora rosea]
MDEPTRVLLLSARLRAVPWRLPELLAELLRADSARWVYGGAAGRPGEPRPFDATQLTVPVGPRQAVRLHRVARPFTSVEAARAAAFVRLARPPATDGRPVRLADGTEVTVAPLAPSDQQAVRDLHERCSPESRRFRYFSTGPALPPRLRCHAPAHSLVACHEDRMVGLASLLTTAAPGVAELAFLIEDRWQGMGLGTAMARMLLREARDRGLAEVRATLLSDNTRMRRLLIALGAALAYTGDPGVLTGSLPLTAARTLVTAS